MLMNPDGSGVERLGPSNVRAIHPSWSWDSKQVWYCTDDDLRPPRKNPSAIYYVDVATRQVKLVIEGGVNTYPSLSPDGTHLLFRRMIGEMNSEVFVANRDGTDQRNRTNHPAFDGWPEWSPDGSRIAFASNRNSNYQIFVMKADGSDVKRVANTRAELRLRIGHGMARSSILPIVGRLTLAATARSSPPFRPDRALEIREGQYNIGTRKTSSTLTGPLRVFRQYVRIRSRNESQRS
jgi:dipeptidyl aminopeptidase/acylaminoacyl peptidase